MNCNDFESSLNDSFDHLPDTLPASMIGHVSSCDLCRQTWSDFQTLNLAVGRWKSALPAVDLVNRVQTALSSHTVSTDILAAESAPELLTGPLGRSMPTGRRRLYSSVAVPQPTLETLSSGTNRQPFLPQPYPAQLSQWTKRLLVGIASVAVIGIGINFGWPPGNGGREQAATNPNQQASKLDPQSGLANADRKTDGSAIARDQQGERDSSTKRGKSDETTSARNLAATPGIRRAAVKELQSAYRRLASEARESMPDVAGLIAASPTTPAQRNGNDRTATGSSVAAADPSSSPFAFAAAVQQPLADGVSKVGNRLKPIGSDVSRSISFLWNVAEMGE